MSQSRERRRIAFGPRRRGLMLVYRILLSILLGLTLTLTCQGHHMSDQHTGPHITLLAEHDPAHSPRATVEEEAGEAAPAHSEAYADDAHPGAELHAQPHDISSLEPLHQPSRPIPVQFLAESGFPSFGMAHGLNSIDMQVAIIFLIAGMAVRRYFAAANRQPLLPAGIYSRPDDPPPRSVSPAL